MRLPRTAPVAVVGLGFAAFGALWWTAGLNRANDWVPAFLLGYTLTWFSYVVASIVVTRTRVPRWMILWIIIGAIGLRVAALHRTPPLSTDVWRYLWDGRVANAGINPFQYPPNAREVSHLRDANWQPINFKHISTIYPPTAEMLFSALARIRDQDAEAFRWAFMFFDVGNVLLLIVLLRRTSHPPERVIWYAWCPLPIVESTAGAHVDSVGIFLLLLAFLFTHRADGKPSIASGVFLAASVMAKGYSLLATPFFLRRGGWRTAVAFAVTSIALILPYLNAGRQLFGGLGAYLGAWETNSSIFLLIDRNLRSVTEAHSLIARIVTIAMIVVAIAVLAWRQKPGLESLMGSSFAVFGAQLFLGAPTLPWYAAWLIPALCWRVIPGVVLFTLTVSAQYYARWLFPGDAAMHDALLWIGYLPVYALLLGQAVKHIFSERGR